MKLPPLLPARFVRRDNRFRATIEIDGRPAAAHVPNSGRLSELFVPGTPIWVSRASTQGRKTAYDLRLVAYANTLVSIDARLPAPLLAEAWREGRLSPFTECEELEQEVRSGHSRLDLRLWRAGEPCWVEAKSVTLVEDGVALFPDAPTSRGARHLEELIRLRQEGARAAVIFVVQRSDARSFAPNAAADPTFTRTLSAAADAGVEIWAFTCRVSLTEITLDRAIPVRLDDISQGPH